MQCLASLELPDSSYLCLSGYVSGLWELVAAW